MPMFMYACAFSFVYGWHKTQIKYLDTIEKIIWLKPRNLYSNGKNENK